MPAALACASAEVHGRKIVPSTLIRHDDVGLCIRYTCQRDSLVKITKERWPKVCAYNSKAHLDLGDQVRGKSVAVYVASKRVLRRSKVSGYSGTHSNGYLETHAQTYAELTEAFENLVNSATAQQVALPAPAKQLPLAAPAKGNPRRSR